MENNTMETVKPNRRKSIIIISVIIVVLGSIGGLIYYNISSKSIYVENSTVSAPVINLAPTAGGILQEVFVNSGDLIQANSPIARVGNELIKAPSAGQIISINKNIGAYFGGASPLGAGQTVASMINPADLKVIGEVQEDKGFRDVKVGQTAVFTVDAFGSKKYSGIVDEVNPTSNAGDIVFNISGTRQEMNFDVKVRFDENQYPELKNGMSAKLWITK